MRFFFVAVMVVIGVVRAAVDPAMECAFCQIALGMTEEIEVQVKFMEKMKSEKCGKLGNLEKKACEFALDKAASAILGKAAPEATCAKIGLCKDQYASCKLYDAWPVKKLPDQPKEWPVERRELGALPDYEAELQKFLKKVMDVVSAHESSATPLPSGSDTKFYDFMAKLMSMQFSLKALLGGATAEQLAVKDSNGCAMFDIKCKGVAMGKHLPFSDVDGDFYSTKPEMRGSDWRGQDCDDKNADVHPGRAIAPDSVAADSDWNCNQISGKNETGTYEDMFCTGANAPRPLLALGDSATAHFHLPPQWFTAKGWNLDGLRQVLEDEMDATKCSWSTGHALNTQSCPFQEPVPGVAEGEVVSLYTQLRARNRCNHNAYTNIGVNGARMTSASGLVDAVKIDKDKDHPVTLWLSLIGNDVCKSDTNYTPLDEFYNDAIATLTRLDGMLPAGSTVISLALFNGELLYDTMHAQQHPIGTSYSTMYDWLNCLQVSPCFGWLNSDGAIRRQTTEWANKLNDQYRKIQAQSKTLFKNIDYVFYDADYNNLFGSYVKAGLPGTNLIEKVDGFHPSQAGNAAFAITFFQWLQENHPNAVGAVNPHNAEIDALFFPNK